MRSRMLFAAALLALLAGAGHAGVRTYPPSGTGGISGGGGPLPSQAVPPVYGAVSYWRMEDDGSSPDEIAANDLTWSAGISRVAGHVGTYAHRSTGGNPARKEENVAVTGMNALGDYTIAAWVRCITCTTSPDNGFVIYDVVGARDLVNFRRAVVVPSQPSWSIKHTDAGGVKSLDTNPAQWTITTGTWFLAVATYDSTADTLTLEVADAGTTFPDSSTTLTSVGSLVAPAGAVRFTIYATTFGSTWEYDEPGVWSRMLSPSEKQDLFAGVVW